MLHKMDFIGNNGIPFRAVLIPAGEDPENYPAAKSSKRHQIEFYDRRYNHTPDGQFTGGRYYVETFMEGYGCRTILEGLSLQGDVPDWALSGTDWATVQNWVAYIINQKGFPRV